MRSHGREMTGIMKSKKLASRSLRQDIIFYYLKVITCIQEEKTYFTVTDALWDSLGLGLWLDEDNTRTKTLLDHLNMICSDVYYTFWH